MAVAIADLVLSPLIEIAIKKLASPQVWDFFRRREGNEELCEKLRMLLVFMDPLVAYAEQKQINDTSVRVWLNYIRHAVLDAEDLLDEIDVEVTQRKLDSESQTINGWKQRFFSRFRSFDNKIERMEKIVDRLEFLLKKRDLLQLKNASGDDVALAVEREKRKSTAHPHESDNVMFGREAEKAAIINSLTENGDKVSVISIVGMGGVGKTLLAQEVFNDPKVKSRFDVQGWICVSDDFNAKKVLEAILEAIPKSAKDDKSSKGIPKSAKDDKSSKPIPKSAKDDKPSEKQSVDEKLRKELTAKKYLLVLDDVWNENRDQWEDVKTPLNCGVPGSKILVTTRTRDVAESCIRSDIIHELKELQENHSWEVFVKHAFGDENHQLNTEFQNIGIDIVAKCKGLPLALEAMGSLLYGKSISQWETVLNSEIWQLKGDKIIPALLLSYHHLPSHLKRCFAFCALFPKDFNFDREELILLWMGENYLQCYNQNKSMEKVGQEYFDDLLSRSFFQQSSKNPKYYVMHDLLYDLARYVCGDVCFKLEVEEAQSITEKTRHFSFLTNYISNLEGSKDLYKDSRLRTFLPLGWSQVMVYDKYDVWSSGAPICDLLWKCRFLRVLSLCNNEKLTKVPDSVGNLKHLRSLDLSGTCIKKLPRSTCSLFNLHILKLQSCESLKELPSDLHKQTKLHHLDLRGTELRKLPKQLGKLKNLQILMGSFRVGKGGGFKIKQLGELNLHGELHISDMQNIVNPSDALAANFKKKMHLVKLKLEWSEKHDVSEQEKDVLENLQPSKHLEKLTIENYGGKEFPRWFGDESLSNLVSLKLSNCQNCMFLPSFGQLSSLKKLSISRFSGIEVIGQEFYGSPSSSFASLETLKFQSMEKWKKWECKVVTGAFPKLRELSIDHCPKLEEPLSEQLPCLEKLNISGCKELVRKIGQKIEEHGRMETPRSEGECSMKVWSVDYYFPNPIQHSHNSLVDLSIEDCNESLTTFPLDFFPNLRSLYLGGCDNLQMISQEHAHNHLKELSIDRCSQFESFPKEGLSAPRLERFSICELKNLKSLSKQMDTLLPSLIQLSIVDCPEVELISDECLPSNLKELYLDRWSKFMASLKGSLEGNTSIESMEISRMDVESFPDEGFLPRSLTSLHIHDCKDLKRLNYRGLCHPSSLTYLILNDCPSIECLPEEGLPKSISYLFIGGNCPLLKQRCQKPNGKDWRKIERIQDYIQSDDDEISQNMISGSCNKVLDLVGWRSSCRGT